MCGALRVLSVFEKVMLYRIPEVRTSLCFTRKSLKSPHLSTESSHVPIKNKQTARQSKENTQV